MTDAAPLVLDGGLWRYALAFYAAPGASAACLRLQDEAGVDVVELIFALYASRVLGLPVDRALLEAARDDLGVWRQDTVLPLRAIRRRLKPARTDCPDATKEELRRLVQQAELKAEQIQLALLEQWARARPGAGGPASSAMDAVAEVLALSNASPEGALSDAVGTVVAAAGAAA
ncbi:TIGR02444 family protein [Ancylobacter sp. MQZ15Z-1]|uniref:TIGR02444 family protein n=1 Tax=Ancylobacter mangrovi TaxID=2972472 RepID=A0A9X2PI05_9HYPH|nr:TIGR02444 family protein [Ancylobacter mangrovi]MCS0496548.1 TIGR02444 family protein [Ancylobacter mangrovi]